MIIKEHQKEVKKLNKLERELSTLIANTDNVNLMDKFFKWQDQRNVCNQGFNKVIETMVKQSNL